MRPIVLLSFLIPTAIACDAWSQRPKTAFDGEAALRYAQAQVAFGPRVPGTPAHKAAGDWIVEQMRARADTVIVQTWTHLTLDNRSLPMRNVFAQFNPSATQRVLYVTHWDTRPTADSDVVLGNRTLPIDGANDGASGVGLFVALADQLKKVPPSIGVDLLFVDGEDWGSFDGYEDGDAPDVLIGSTYFAMHLPRPGYQPLFAVVWDMIGDADLGIQQEGYSLQAAPEVVQRVWRTAADLGYQKHFQPQQRDGITDDHLPLIRIAKMRAIDVIDIEYPYHHTRQDTMDKISSRSLQIVGDVALTLLTGR